MHQVIFRFMMSLLSRHPVFYDCRNNESYGLTEFVETATIFLRF